MTDASQGASELRLVEAEPAGGRAGARDRPDDQGERRNRLTIEQLAQETGMTVRNIRAHQARGLLPPPEVRLRTGYYGDEHVARLRMIQELQAEGFNLRGIERLLNQTPLSADRLLGFKHAITTPFQTESPAVFTLEELTERFGPEASPKALQKAEEVGALVSLGGGRYEAPSPSLLDAAEEVTRRGIHLTAALSAVESLKRHSEAVARRFVKLFLDGVWRPFEECGHPEERWSEVSQSIERLRPLASEVLLAVFQQTMTREVEAAFGKELERRARRGR